MKNRTVKRCTVVTGVLALLLTAAVQVGTGGVAAAAQDHPRNAPTTFSTGTVWDLAQEYFINWGDAKSASGDPRQIEKTHLDADGFVYLLKQSVDLTRWERYRLTGTTVELDRDTTAPAGQPANSYNQHGAWMPRQWTVGREVTNDITLDWFDKNTCRYQKHETLRSGIYRKYLRYQGPLTVGGSLGVQDTIVIDFYFYLDSRPVDNQDYHNPVEAERFWFVRGRGWVRWEWFRDRTATPRWNAANRADLENSGANTVVKFNQNWPAGNALRPTKVCTNGIT